MVVVDVIDPALPRVDVPYRSLVFGNPSMHNPILFEILHSMPSYGIHPIPEGTGYVPR